MLEYGLPHLFGTFLGGFVAIMLLSLLFRYALFGRSATKLQKVGVVLFTGLVATGFYGFGDGSGGFSERVTTPLSLEPVIGYIVPAFLLALLLYFKKSPEKIEEIPNELKKSSVVGRAFALVFVVPVILIGMMNLASNAYSQVVGSHSSATGLGITHSQIRANMLNGDMAQFWRIVDEKAPDEIEYIIDRLIAQEDEIKTREDVRRIFNEIVGDFRVTLATYGPALNDVQRKHILNGQLNMLKALESRPQLCTTYLMEGGKAMSQAELRSVATEFNDLTTAMTTHLLDARVVAAGGATLPVPPTEDDYRALFEGLVLLGLGEDELTAIAYANDQHPEFCSLFIAFYEAAIALDGPAGNAIRFELTQDNLTSR
ncbi:hypothetical protein [Ruegeria arenilitoris]|uniref:hypothetical protein n=1 Tax=Ruegeria arenilitoris TaxID=1173585 RepID=UPI00147D3A1D|nr:hypothetical protein [Ruegeria arenilitoris]